MPRKVRNATFSINENEMAIIYSKMHVFAVAVVSEMANYVYA